jgi:hypothetical protein
MVPSIFQSKGFALIVSGFLAVFLELSSVMGGVHNPETVPHGPPFTKG